MSSTVDDTAVGTTFIRLTIPAKPEYITLGRLALTGIARMRPNSVSAEVLGDLKLALTEACTNSVRHAYGDEGGTVEIGYALHRDKLIVEVADQGNGLAASGGRFPFTEDELMEGGLGIAIIEALSDELEISQRPGGGSSLRFVKRLS
jgi:serine/threonine-protein kinase RsbW